MICPLYNGDRRCDLSQLLKPPAKKSVSPYNLKYLKPFFSLPFYILKPRASKEAAKEQIMIWTQQNFGVFLWLERCPGDRSVICVLRSPRTQIFINCLSFSRFPNHIQSMRWRDEKRLQESSEKSANFDDRLMTARSFILEQALRWQSYWWPQLDLG